MQERLFKAMVFHKEILLARFYFVCQETPDAAKRKAATLFIKELSQKSRQSLLIKEMFVHVEALTEPLIT
jgi:hypothetical protein